MINGFEVITLCGSTRFKDKFLEAQKRLTLEGNVVISVGLFGHSGDDEVWSEGVKKMLDRQHLAKIDLADEIFVINVGAILAIAQDGKSPMQNSKASLSYILKTARSPAPMISLQYLANSMSLANSLMKTGRKQNVGMTRNENLLLRNTMLAKALGPIYGKKSM
jgi:hypothetical protein